MSDSPDTTASATKPVGDPLSRIPMDPAGWPFLLPVVALTVLLFLIGWEVAGWITGLIAVYVAAFFRDPARGRPEGIARPVVAPSDGRVALIEEVETDLLPGGRALRIGIFLSVLDVHVNRAPVPGRVIDVIYKPGKFLNALDEASATENERNDIHMDTPYGCVVVRQIAGLIARRIVCRAKRGDEYALGDRIGVIRFGSRTEVFLPPEAEARVEIGQYIRGAKTLLAEIPEAQASKSDAA